jgi:hypothetical protein
MPFTFSHPAIVLPLGYLPNKWVSLTGLVIGSLTPDFEYFLRMRIQSDYSHTVGGIFLFDLPLGILLAFIFHNIVRSSLIENLPDFLKARFLIFERFRWNQYFKKNYFVVIISILIGAASHILWDGFTHHGGYFVEKLPALADTYKIFGLEMPLLKILQHSSTIIGGLFIAFAIWKMPPTERNSSSINLRYWFIVGVLTIGIVGTRLVTGLDYRIYGNLIVSGISGFMIALVVTSFLAKKKFLGFLVGN